MNYLSIIIIMLLSLTLTACGSCKQCESEPVAEPVAVPVELDLRAQKMQALVDEAPAGAVSRLMEEEKLFEVAEKAPDVWERIKAKKSLTLDDVKALHRLHVSEQVIIDQMDCVNCVFYLTTTEIVELRRDGVSPRVINHMLHSSHAQ